MTILSKAEIEQIAPLCREWYLARVVGIPLSANVPRVGDLLDTLDAKDAEIAKKDAALEAWVQWVAFPAQDYMDRAIELTKAAGIEWPSD